MIPFRDEILPILDELRFDKVQRLIVYFILFIVSLLLSVNF